MAALWSRWIWHGSPWYSFSFPQLWTNPVTEAAGFSQFSKDSKVRTERNWPWTRKRIVKVCVNETCWDVDGTGGDFRRKKRESSTKWEVEREILRKICLMVNFQIQCMCLFWLSSWDGCNHQIWSCGDLEMFANVCRGCNLWCYGLNYHRRGKIWWKPKRPYQNYP